MNAKSSERSTKNRERCNVFVIKKYMLESDRRGRDKPLRTAGNANNKPESNKNDIDNM